MLKRISTQIEERVNDGKVYDMSCIIGRKSTIWHIEWVCKVRHGKAMSQYHLFSNMI